MEETRKPPASADAAPQRDHSAFRISHSTLAQQSAPQAAPQSDRSPLGTQSPSSAQQRDKSSFSTQHSAFSIGATAPCISHSAFPSIGLPRKSAFNPIADKSFDFAVSIYSLAKKLRQAHGEYDLSKQLLRSGTSIGANVAEGVRAQSKADFISKMAIALKEANETDFWLRLLHKVGLIDENEFTDCSKDNNELISLLTAITKSAAAR